MPPFHNATDTSKDIVETVNSEILFHSNSHFPFSLHDDESNLHSDDGDGTNKKRAFERVLTHHQAPIIGRKRAISVMAIDIDVHHKKRKISSECVPNWTPEEATLPLCTNLTTLLATSAELYATFFRNPPEHVTPFFNHHINAVIRDGTLVLPGTPPGTISRRRALQPPLTRMRTQSFTVTSSTAPPQLTELVQCPSVTPMPKMPLTPTSTTTFPIMASP
jgi:hypothetical protein